ncbi:hypothetical protein [Thauera sp. SDU_THAU2]|uniref:hypothetical protein n=1 Tax=Thauera sp. SDU_THAU2 TaxID=3136633 RepID=UPI00311F48D0
MGSGPACRIDEALRIRRRCELDDQHRGLRHAGQGRQCICRQEVCAAASGFQLPRARCFVRGRAGEYGGGRRPAAHVVTDATDQHGHIHGLGRRMQDTACRRLRRAVAGAEHDQGCCFGQAGRWRAVPGQPGGIGHDDVRSARACRWKGLGEAEGLAGEQVAERRPQRLRKAEQDQLHRFRCAVVWHARAFLQTHRERRVQALKRYDARVKFSRKGKMSCPFPAPCPEIVFPPCAWATSMSARCGAGP